MVGWVLDTGPPESNRQMQTSRCALILNPVLNFKIKRHPWGVGLLSLQSVLFRSGQPEKIGLVSGGRGSSALVGLGLFLFGFGLFWEVFKVK